ncbi:hypothetical protein ACFYTQ_23920 [Nocardia sp. NPDC004068]|uniref:hypothetical protein n=1 Tax=Nocardia sp. NPDC004068 TaxID=3364303 RepID=UPI0036A52BDE
MRLVFAGIVCGATLFGMPMAHAEPLTPDYAQAPNGTGAAAAVTPAWSPIQLPPTEEETLDGTTTIVAHPYLSPWVHDLVPLPADAGVEVLGAARVSLPLGSGRTLVVNPNGHCVFGAPATQALPPLRVGTGAFELVIEPSIRH